jgi:hypothetical protein
VRQQPDNETDEGDEQDEKNNPAFTALFSHRSSPRRTTGCFAETLVLQGDRDIEPGPLRARAIQQFIALLPRFLLRYARRIRDHALEFLHLIAQLRFLARKFFLAEVERGARFIRATKHAASLDTVSHPEKDNERGDAKNNQRQTESETDFHPVAEIASFVEHVGHIRRRFRQSDIAAAFLGL